MLRCFRLFNPDVTPLQVWDLDLGGGRKFWQMIGARRVQELQQLGISPPLIADMIVNALLKGCRLLTGFQSVYLAGGLTELPNFKTALRDAHPPWPTFVSHAGQNYSLWAARHMFANEKTIVVDVGQTAIKGFLPDGTRIIFKRDLDLIPYGDGPDKTERSIFFLRSAVKALREADPSAQVLLSLPAPVSIDLVPGPNSYGLEGYKTLLDDVFEDSEGTVYVVNDAELAAECARGVNMLKPGPVLAMTLGLGPGAALLSPPFS